MQASEGSQQNLDRLRSPASTFDLAFIQGGFGYLGNAAGRSGLSRVETLVNVDIEPVWIFSKTRDIESLLDLQGLRVAVGPNGSVSRHHGAQPLP